jgi:hypothetical protein
MASCIRTIDEMLRGLAWYSYVRATAHCDHSMESKVLVENMVKAQIRFEGRDGQRSETLMIVTFLAFT